MNLKVLLAASAALLASGCMTTNTTNLTLPRNYKLLYAQDFNSEKALGDFHMTDPTSWAVSEGRATQSLELTKQSKYQPTVRSPVNIALIEGLAFTDFVLEADLMQSGREYGHRDMCLFFGFQSPTQFYYTHIATAADPNAHNVFIVNDAPRKNFARETTKGVNWGLNVWHKVRLVRNTKEGTIQVYFDDMHTPIMVAEDKTFGAGHIGFGSFDDTGKIDNIRIWGPAAEKRSAAFWKK